MTMAKSQGVRQVIRHRTRITRRCRTWTTTVEAQARAGRLEAVDKKKQKVIGDFPSTNKQMNKP